MSRHPHIPRFAVAPRGWRLYRARQVLAQAEASAHLKTQAGLTPQQALPPTSLDPSGALATADASHPLTPSQGPTIEGALLEAQRWGGGYQLLIDTETGPLSLWVPPHALREPLQLGSWVCVARSVGRARPPSSVAGSLSHEGGPR